MSDWKQYDEKESWWPLIIVMAAIYGIPTLISLL